MAESCCGESVADGGDEDSEDEADDNIPWLGYNEVSQVHSGKSLVMSRRPKQAVGSLVDIVTKKSINFRGNLHLNLPCWEVVALRTKKARDKNHYPADANALAYRLRNDPKRFVDNVVHILLTKIGNDLSTERAEEAAQGPGNRSGDQADGEEATKDKFSVFLQGKDMFYKYLGERNEYDDLDIYNLEERVTEFHDSVFGELQNHSKEDNDQTVNPFLDDQFKIVHHFKLLVLKSLDFRGIKLGQSHSNLLRYLPQLFPNQFLGLIKLKENQQKKLATTVEESPGHLAFKPIVARECDILGVETNSDALERSGLMAKVPQVEREAILMYEYIKDKTKQDGHTCVKFDAIMNYFGSILSMIEEAHEFLEDNKVTKTKMEGGYRMVYLLSLWKAEKQIADGIHSLIDLQEKEPWKLDVDWDTDNFKTIKEDGDQWRAAQLIASQPVVAISGKGGCGKTHVVTQVITSAKAASLKDTKMDGEQDDVKKDDKTCNENDSQVLDDSDLDNYDEEMKPQRFPETVNLLLTAPTGKAANLLGKRADLPSYTLHQVIFSYRALDPDTEWKHRNVNTLVVDECSLVAVTTFAFLIQLLLENAKLRRIVLLGDVRQLPSIEPGNFLEDVFQSLSRLGCGIELRNNHRAESQIVIDNATRISKKIYPEFVAEKFTLLPVPEGNPAETGDDLVNDDTEHEVMKVLNHPSLKDDSRSQFISFTRKICERINEACCRKYSGHSIKTHKNHWDFRINDKICCTKNGYVRTFDEQHGIMVVKRKNADPMKCKTNNTLIDETASIENPGTSCRQTGLQQGDPYPAIPLAQDKTAENDKVGAENKQGTDNKKEEIDRKRLCNGEIYFIEEDKIIVNEQNCQNEYLFLSERDPECPEAGFWVDRRELKRECKIMHAWARTIHTFQGSETDHIVYIVGKKNRHQNWQHVYTAITRGRKSVFIIGQDSVLRQVIKTQETKRQTSLRKQLTALLQKNTSFMSSQSVLKQSFLNMSPVPSQANPSTTQMILAELAEEHDSIDSILGKMDMDSPKLNHTKSFKDMPEKKASESDKLCNNGVINNQNDVKKSRLKLKKNLQTRFKETDIPNNSAFLNGSLSGSVSVFNTSALRLTKTPRSFGQSECRSVAKGSARTTQSNTHSNNFCDTLGSFGHSECSIATKGSTRTAQSNTHSNNLCDTHHDNDDSYVIDGYDSPSPLNEPKSNESMWSEADESQYISFVDATMFSINAGDKTCGAVKNGSLSELDVKKHNLAANTQEFSISETPQFTKIKPLLKASLFRESLSSSSVKKLGYKSPNRINDSAFSPWSDVGSDVGEEEYLGLTLEDIENMESDFDTKSEKDRAAMRTTEHDSGDACISDDDTSLLNDSESLTKTDGRVMKTSEALVEDTPPAPCVPDTPPDKYSRKRRSGDNQNEDFMSPTKTKNKKDLSLTPLKRSLAELQFD